MKSFELRFKNAENDGLRFFLATIQLPSYAKWSPTDRGMFTTQPYMRRILQSSLLLAGLFLVSPASADEAPTAQDIKRAARAYDQGRERFREEQYTEAAEKFETADGYAPSAAALRLAIFARKEAGQLDRALTHAALALELYPNDAELVGEAQAIVDEDGANFARVDVTCDQPCELLLNNRIVHGRASTSRRLYIAPGTAEIRASWSAGRTQSETFALGAGSQQDANFFAPEIPDDPDTFIGTEDSSMSSGGTDTEDKRDGWHPAVFYTGLSLSIIGLTSTAILGVNAQNNPGPDAVKQNCVRDDEECEDYKQGRRNQAMVNVALGTTAALGVFTIVSAIMTDWGKKKEKDESFSYTRGDLSIRPTFEVGSGAAFGARGTF